MFVFQFVGGGGRGHILAQGPQLKISIHKQGGFANLGETIRDERAEKAAEDRQVQRCLRELQPALPPSPTLAFPLIATTASGPPAGQSSSSAADPEELLFRRRSRPTEYPVSDPPTPEESDSEVTDYDSLPPVPVSGGVRHHDHDTESEKKKKKNN